MKVLIIGISLVGLLSVAGAIYVGTKSFDGTVVRHPYEEGLAWDDEQDAVERLGWKAIIMTRHFIKGKDDLEIALTDRKGRPLSGAGLEIAIGRPATSEYDRILTASEIKDGLYRAQIELPEYGYWDVRLKIGKNGSIESVSKRIFAEEK